MRKTVIAEEVDLIAKMEKAGVTVTRPDPELFRALAQPAREEISQFAGEENAKKFIKMVEDERRR